MKITKIQTPAVRLSDRALLVSLSISQWTARKLDKRETQALAAKHGAAEGMARVNKLLLPKDGSLDAVHKVAGEIRTAYYTQTLPWAVDGSRILPSANYLAFAQEIRAMLDKWHRAKDTFLLDYPQLQADAQRLLNGMFNADDYPSQEKVARKFAADVTFFPIPDAKDFRRTLLDEEAAAREAEIEETYRRVTQEAMNDCWRRLYEVVERAVERLADPSNIFRDSLVENAVEVCRLLPRLNIADDPNLERMRNEVERALCRQQPDTLRKAPEIRQEVADKCRDIMSKMGAFFEAD